MEEVLRRRPVRLVVASILVAASVIACSGPGGSPTGDGVLPTPGAAATPTPRTAGSSPARTAAGGESRKPFPTKKPGATPRPVVAFHEVGDLESRLPTQVAGATLVTESVSGTGFRDARSHKAGLRCHWYEGRGLRCRDQQQLDAVLAALGHSREDVSIAVAYTVARGGAEIQVMRVTGVTGAALRDGMLAVMTADASAGKRQFDVQTTSIGGRDVRVVGSLRPYPLGRRFLYAAADALYEIRMVSDDAAAQIIPGLT
jgi:hypothetical protein